jgi:hypothetical protein
MKRDIDKIVEKYFDDIKKNTYKCNSNNTTRLCDCSHMRSCKHKIMVNK